MNARTTLALTKRKEFSGVNDKYARKGPFPLGPRSAIFDALQGLFPFDVFNGSFFSDHMRDITTRRLNRYRLYRKFYNGHHWIQPFEDGERKAVFNYCKLIVDKGIDFFAAKGWKVSACEGNEDIAQFLNDVWEYNNRGLLTQIQLMYGARDGDSFFYVTVKTNENGKELSDGERTVEIVALDPSHCFPVWSSSTPGVIDSILIQYPVVDTVNRKMILRSVYITAEYFQIWDNDQEVGTKQPNPFGRVNVVHIPNFVVPPSVYGESDIEPLIPVNEEYNTVANSIRRIVKYHAEPTTLIYGIRASQLEKGAKKVWSGLPIDAKVENLQLEGDLSASHAYLDELKAQILRVGNVPKAAFDHSDEHISNTSGLALQLLFQPLIDKTVRRQKAHSVGITRVNELIIIAYRKILGVDVGKLADNEERLYETWPEYSSALPRDIQAELDRACKMVEQGFWSIAEAQRRLSDVTDFSRLALEIAADRRRVLVFKYEEQKAVNGIRPNLAAVFLGSEYLTEDVEDVMKSTVEQGAEKRIPQPPPPPALPASPSKPAPPK